jgi:hypothetical protein
VFSPTCAPQTMKDSNVSSQRSFASTAVRRIHRRPRHTTRRFSSCEGATTRGSASAWTLVLNRSTTTTYALVLPILNQSTARSHGGLVYLAAVTLRV